MHRAALTSALCYRDPEGHFWTVGAPIRTVTRDEAEVTSGLKVVQGWA